VNSTERLPLALGEYLYLPWLSWALVIMMSDYMILFQLVEMVERAGRPRTKSGGGATATGRDIKPALTVCAIGSTCSGSGSNRAVPSEPTFWQVTATEPEAAERALKDGHEYGTNSLGRYRNTLDDLRCKQVLLGMRHVRDDTNGAIGVS
jgi:hypothetical protein